jgi:hypothetical protein
VGGRDSLTSQIKHQQQVSGNGPKPSIAKLFEQGSKLVYIACQKLDVYFVNRLSVYFEVICF